MSLARVEGLSLRQAALVVGFTYLLGPVSYAEFTIYPKLVIPGHIDQTVANIASHQGLFVTALLCYVVNFIEDIVIAWALYVLLAPVNRALSLLASLFQLVYAGIGFMATANLAKVYHMVTTPEYASTFGTVPLAAQINLLLHSFRIEYSLSLILFAIHLVLIGYLIARSTYMPWWLGVLLVIDGLAWIVTELQPYVAPAANVDFLFPAFFGELVFMVWLLIFGWRIREREPTMH